MHYSSGLEYIVGNSYSYNYSAGISYFSKNVNDNYSFKREHSPLFETHYKGRTNHIQYNKNQLEYLAAYSMHSFTPEIFLKQSRQKTRFIGDNNEIKSIAEEIFELMMKEKLPGSISLNILPFDEFKALHSLFGSWNNGILGFSLNGSSKKIFVRENNLDALMIVIGHEIGHVLTETLPNKHNVANLGLSIKDDLDFQPARNGLHDVVFEFVNSMAKKGINSFDLHNNLIKKYISVFDRVY